jgi:hypothetical protein
MNTRAVFGAHGDFAKAIGYGDQIPDPQYRAIAIKSSAGFYVQYLKLKQAPFPTADIARVCGKEAGDMRATCLNGLLDGIMEFGAPGEQYKEGAAFCGDQALGALAKECFAHLATAVQTFYPKGQLTALCALTPKGLQPDACFAARPGL